MVNEANVNSDYQQVSSGKVGEGGNRSMALKGWVVVQLAQSQGRMIPEKKKLDYPSYWVFLRSASAG